MFQLWLLTQLLLWMLLSSCILPHATADVQMKVEIRTWKKRKINPWTMFTLRVNNFIHFPNTHLLSFVHRYIWHSYTIYRAIVETSNPCLLQIDVCLSYSSNILQSTLWPSFICTSSTLLPTYICMCILMCKYVWAYVRILRIWTLSVIRFCIRLQNSISHSIEWVFLFFLNALRTGWMFGWSVGGWSQSNRASITVVFDYNLLVFTQ